MMKVQKNEVFLSEEDRKSVAVKYMLITSGEVIS
jgi:hypothetical protein